MGTKNSGAKLWSRGGAQHPEVEAFTAGDDHLLDLALIPYDCAASAAHAEMLARIGVLSKREADRLVRELNTVRRLHRRGVFTIDPSQEDAHTAIEQHLVSKLGALGKKIHTGRSRNDQVLAALRLYYKDELDRITALAAKFIRSLEGFRKKYGGIAFPGYTHTRKAMPASMRLWAGSFRDAMKDNLSLAASVMKLIDQSPLGTGAGFGVPLKLDRAFAAKRAGFSRVQRNAMYVQHSRGKFEGALLHLLLQILYDLNRCASDVIFYSIPEIGYMSLPDTLTTGSSIMPQKKNPDVLEVVRARYHTVLGYAYTVQSLPANLLSGYNRDIQLTKEPVMKSISIVRQCLSVMSLVIGKTVVHPDACESAMTGELYATEAVYALVAEGVPFRDAYRRIAETYK
jgi:argininosuccinate lyase